LIRQHNDCRPLEELIQEHRRKSRNRQMESHLEPNMIFLSHQRLLQYFEDLSNASPEHSKPDDSLKEAVDRLSPIFSHSVPEEIEPFEPMVSFRWQDFVEGFEFAFGEDASFSLLLKNVDNASLALLSRLLLSNSVSQEHRMKLKLHPVSWAGLILSYITQEDFLKRMELKELARILIFICELIRDSTADDRHLVLDLFKDFCYATTNVCPFYILNDVTDFVFSWLLLCYFLQPFTTRQKG
jgi:hypothetical protein